MELLYENRKISPKSSIVDVRLGSKYTSGSHIPSVQWRNHMEYQIGNYKLYLFYVIGIGKLILWITATIVRGNGHSQIHWLFIFIFLRWRQAAYLFLLLKVCNRFKSGYKLYNYFMFYFNSRYVQRQIVVGFFPQHFNVRLYFPIKSLYILNQYKICYKFLLKLVNIRHHNIRYHIFLNSFKHNNG